MLVSFITSFGPSFFFGYVHFFSFIAQAISAGSYRNYVIISYFPTQYVNSIVTQRVNLTRVTKW
jgi:hypothetical protein